ncbi:MAG: hypothetical protein CMD65_04900 [Gammaproteobacteria bacterium]|nr:hypothetical protein [Gammaproteobacteria bacterium]|tara:strand:+ start:2691 stop:4241 length:1551 start_codon:yes stop_codon:yes gene_type:complete
MKQDTFKLLNTALQLHHRGKLDEADKIYQLILKSDQNNFDANHLHGLILSQNKKYKDSLKYFEKAIKLNNNFEINNNIGIAYKNLKNFKMAEKFFMSAIELDKNNYKSYFNCANLYQDNLEYEKAINFYEKSIEYNKEYYESYLRIAEVYRELFLKNRDEKYLFNSKKYLSKLININPTHSEAHIALGMMQLWLSEIDESCSSFDEAVKLDQQNKYAIELYIKKYANDINSLKTLIKHEYEQLSYLIDQKMILVNDIDEKYYKEIQTLHSKINSSNFDINTPSTEIKEKLYKIRYKKNPNISKENFINISNDINKLEDEYLSNHPEILVVDNFLDKEALLTLRKYCNEANIFKFAFHNGYVGAFLTKGLSNKFVLKLSEDLRQTFSRIFTNLRLTQAWIFKYDSKRFGTGIHADQARVNVNFWITSDDSNLDHNNGGLILWDKIPPDEWSFEKYNSIESSSKIEKMLNKENISKRVIEYKENRAIIFNSKLFHATDDFHFMDNHIDRRLNITFLYD